MKENSFCMYDFINEVANDYNAHVHYKKSNEKHFGSGFSKRNFHLGNNNNTNLECVHSLEKDDG